MLLLETVLGPKDLRAFLTLGVSLACATRDDRMVVEITRCSAAELDADGNVLLALPMPEGRRAFTNIETTGVIALTAALPLDYTTVQLKGTNAAPVDWPARVRAVAAQRGRFAEMMKKVGLPEDFADRMWSTDCRAVSFTPSAVYNQTPGPGAGLSVAP